MSKFMHDFVHSLTKREKAYFDRFSKTYSTKETNYIKIYNALLQMEHFDTKKFAQKFNGTSIEKYMSSELNYLFEQILRSLCNFHFDTSIQRKLRKSILFLDILIEKGMRKKALKILKRGKKTAYYYEEFTTSLRYIQFEERLVFKEGIVGFAEKLDQLQKEREKLYAQIQNLNELRLIREQVRELQFTVQCINRPENYPKFYGNPILNSPNGALSQKAKQHWHYIRAVRTFLRRDYKNALKESFQYIEHLYQYEHLIDKANFLPALSNHSYFAGFELDKEEFYYAMDKLDSLAQKENLDKTYIEYIKLSRLFELYYQLENNVACGKLMKKATDFIHGNYREMGSVQINYMVLIMTRNCIQLGRFAEGVDWINFWHTAGLLKYNQLPYRLLSMILYFELKWFDLLSAENESSYKIIPKNSPDRSLYLVFHKFYKKYLKEVNAPERHFIQLIKQLESIKVNQDQNFAFSEFDYLRWANQRKKRLNLNTLNV